MRSTLSRKIDYLFIAGLEHSGTTLLSQMLSTSKQVLALGEVGQFFSRKHMKNYLHRWGELEDVKRCSCGVDWSDCHFWQPLIDKNGVYDDQDLQYAYKDLLNHIQNNHDYDVIVDSSKSLSYLNAMLASLAHCTPESVDALVLLVAKDPRGFAYSMGRKNPTETTILSYFSKMNLWRGIYQEVLNRCESLGIDFMVVTYEQICAQPTETLFAVRSRTGVKLEFDSHLAHRNSHIAMGNKEFTERNRSQLKYDDQWKRDWRVSIAYAMNLPARILKWRIFRMAHQDIRSFAKAFSSVG